MSTLPPTVHERLARCGTQVLVTGLAPGADVEVDIGGVTVAFTATQGGGRNLTVAPLVAGDEVRARQDEGTGFSPWSRPVVVEDADVPPVAPPRLPSQVGICSHCVPVDGAVPGSHIVLRVGGSDVGEGTADRHGGGCFNVDLTRFGGDPTGLLSAVMQVCGAESPAAGAVLVVESAIGKPTVIGPLFGCQRVVPLDHVHRGALVRLESTDSPLGGFCSCWSRVDVHIGSALVAGTSVRAQPFWDGRGSCIGPGPWSDWEPVVAPDERIAPTILEPLIAGDQTIRVTGQIVGATRLISIQPTAGPLEEWGPVPSSEEPEIALAAPLTAGSVVTVTQTLCAVSATSEPVVVQPAPPEVFAPTIVPPLHACGGRVQVSNLHSGATVRLFSDGISIGLGYAGNASSIAVDASPSLVEGREITATQQVGSVTSDPSTPVRVIRFEELSRPRVLGPVAFGDRHVWISGLTPGCRVTLTSDGNIIGESYVAETLARVPLTEPVPDVVVVRADICDQSVTADRTVPVHSPCARGPLATGQADLTFDDWPVPATADGVAFTTEMRGEVYFPADGDGELDVDRRNLPVIIVAHGMWDEVWFDPDTGNGELVESFRGYDYLGHHLASWGMLVLSIDMDDVNTSTNANWDGTAASSHAFARGEIILHAIDELLAHPIYGDVADGSRLGIVGHSMAGEGVTAAQQLNRDEGRGYGIRGVVSIAPTRWHGDDIVVSETDYFQLTGSMDQLNFGATGTNAPFAGVRSYDRAERPKTHGWVHGLRHNPFNRRWVGTTDFAESSYADAALPAATHELVARCLVNAFLQRSVMGRAEYAGYMEGTVLPSSLDHVAVHLQHSREPRRVVDNFGDEDTQASHPAEALDPTTNTMGLSIENFPAGSLVPLEDLELIGVPDSSHNTKAVRFAWPRPGGEYRTAIAAQLSPQDAIALRAAQLYDDTATNPEGVAADLFVRLTDANGNEAIVRLGAASTIPYPDHDPDNADGPDPLAMMRTVNLPLDAFTAATPDLDLSDLTAVTLVMSARPTGHLFADDIELWRS